MPPKLSSPSSGVKEQNTEGIHQVDLELASNQAKSKTDHDPFLVAFDEPFDAENPRHDQSDSHIFEDVNADRPAQQMLVSRP